MADLQAAPTTKKSHNVKRADRKSTSAYPQILPTTGHIRVNQLCVFVPFSTSTVWRKVKTGKFPKPVKLSDRVTAWRCEDIRAWIDSFHGA